MSLENRFDEYGRSSGGSYVLGNKTLNYDIEYEDGSDLVSYYTFPDNTVNSYSYDAFDRLTMKKYHNIAYYSQYRYYEPTGTATSSLVSLQYNNFNGGTSKYDYTYDILGNITSVSENNVLKLSYEYDSLGQLVRENNAYANKTWKYYYDNAGNITMRDEYAYTTGTLPSSPQSLVFYDYSTGTWGDMLTSYDGTTISYDAIGNPTNWRNALGLMWSGRQLTYMSIDGLDEGLGASYNADGIRTKKTYWDENANQTVHDYVLDGSKIVKETVTGSSSYTMYYYYDESGVAGFELNGVTYYYLKNIQGDVINILNSSGQIVVTYTYDAWGKVLSVTGSLAGTVGYINPFRYRGYYYDRETGFYYLQTRYYDPTVGRFLNADGYVGANGGIQGYNMFAYCNNMPVMASDPSGEWWLSDAFEAVGNWIGDHAEQIISTVATVAVAVVTVAAVVVTAGAAGAVVGGMAAAYGASTAAAAAIGTAVELGGYAVAYGVGAFATSNVYETWTGSNPIRDNVFNGDETAYGIAEAALMAAAGGYVDVGMSGMPPASECFIAGTLVLTADGLVPIESIEEGDIVVAENPKTGEKDQKRVAQTFVNETLELVHLFVENEEIVTTPTHPFWVINAEWCSAIEIRAGDILKLADGTNAAVTATKYEKLDTPVNVYNFEVEDFHTYYVGEQAVLVHNNCEHDKVAKDLGYKKTNQRSHGQAVYTNKKAPRALRYITYDINSHNRGYWKGADSVEHLQNRTTRSGTYDKGLRRIGK